MDKKRLIALLLAGGLTITASGCKNELAPDLSYMDVLSTTNGESGNNLNNGVEQIRDVEGENFQLVINYKSGSEKWQINANKKLYVEIKTKNLPEDYEVFIDNVHMDTSIVSTKAGYNGIMQDTMDDRIHNSLMLGFPISDNISYFGINEIEGENQTFIQGYGYGTQYYSSSVIEQKRRLESDYLSDGVWANKVDSVIDLIIVDKNTEEVLRTVSVDTSLLVEVNNIIEFEEAGIITKYKYDRNGKSKVLSKTNN